MQKGRGRRAGESHNRRTDDEIRNEERWTRLEQRRKAMMQVKHDQLFCQPEARVTKTGTVKTGSSETRTGIITNSSRECSFQEPVNKTPSLQTPAAAWKASHDIVMSPIETCRARENE
jgi:hypothetical protein